MNNKPHIRLRRALKVACYQVTGQIAPARERHELLTIVQCANEHDKRIMEETLADLFGNKQISKRLLGIASDYGLLERDGTLTDEGKKMLEQEKAFVPEWGDWKIWTCEDPLYRDVILRIERCDKPSSTSSEVYNRRTGDQEEQAPEKLPGYIRKHRVIEHPVFEDKQHVKVVQLDENALSCTDFLRALIEVTLSPSGDTQVTVKRGKTQWVVATPDSLSYDRVLKGLWQSGGLWQAWNGKRNTLGLRFEDTSGKERNTFKKRISIPPPTLPELGSFEDVILKDVGIEPATREDADKWATWLLKEEIRDYQIRGAFEALSKEVRERFPHDDIVLPGQEELAKEVENENRQRFWYLQAPLDWKL